jgi:hypothetical protein
MAAANRHGVTLGNYGSEYFHRKTLKRTRNDRKNARRKRGRFKQCPKKGKWMKRRNKD